MDPTHALAASRTWPPDQRLAFALNLWDELIVSGWQPEPDDELASELDARLAAHELNPTDVRTSEQIRERFRRSFWLTCQAH